MARLRVTDARLGDWEEARGLWRRSVRLEDHRRRTREAGAYVYQSQIGPAWFWSVRAWPWVTPGEEPLIYLPKTLYDGKAATRQAAMTTANVALFELLGDKKEVFGGDVATGQPAPEAPTSDV